MLKYLVFVFLFAFTHCGAATLDDIFFLDGYQKGLAGFLMSISDDVYMDCENGDGLCEDRRELTLSEHGFENIKFYDLGKKIEELNEVISNYKITAKPTGIIKFIDLNELTNYLIDVQAFTSTRRTDDGKDILLIAFRGSLGAKDWVTNLNGYSVKWSNYSQQNNENAIEVHQGFADSFKMFENEINNTFSIDEMSKYDKIILTGHSLGGALATIMYAYLTDQGLKNKLIAYTFGSPAVGNKQFSQKYDLQGNFYRVRNDRDIIPFASYFAFLLEDNILNELDNTLNQVMLFSTSLDERRVKSLEERQLIKDGKHKHKAVFKKIKKGFVWILDAAVGALKAAINEDYIYRHIGEMIVYHDGFRIPIESYENRKFYELLELLEFSQHSRTTYISNIICDFKDIKRGEPPYESYIVQGINGSGYIKVTNINPEPIHWYKKAIVDMCGRRIVEGYSDGNFYPGNNINRAEFLKILLISNPHHPNHDYEYLNYTQDNSFLDVPENEWYSKYVGYASSKKLITGYSDNTFKPGEPITRAEASKLLHDIFLEDLQSNGGKNSLNFTDLQDKTQNNTWFYDKVYFLAEKSIVTGYRDGTFRPGNYINRAEATVIVYRALCNSLEIISCENTYPVVEKITAKF
jgi:hypothetical protein